MRHPGITRPSKRETRLKAKLRANASPEDAVACTNEVSQTLESIFVVLASLFAHLRAIADHLGETARIRGLLRPVAPSNCASIPDGRVWTRFRP